MNKSVELIKSEIYEVKSNLQKFTDLSKKEPENEAHSFYVTYFTNRLTILQQIKSELEAWEVVKPYVDIIDKYTPYPTWQLKPNYDECKLKETNILIKALEVTND